MDTATAIEYAQIAGIGLGMVVAVAIVALVVGAVVRSLSAYAAIRAKNTAAKAEADAKARVAREEADAKVRVLKAKETGLLQQTIALCDAANERCREAERRLSEVTDERDTLAARLAAADADRIAERAAIAAAVVAGIVDATKDELIDLGPGTHRAVEPTSPAGFVPDNAGRASSWQSRATIPDDKARR